ncbi:MAG TPA: C1 family peptidase [Vitreimonas sp.]|uniref:C1 family peptidase n=1 Tax=Vitreimonas sp. TaxID=3069702 RepID=UPI002D5D5532|nr:C1 family peptidase [Vitreimonas sp.]HYD85970.1 C1 family peptidase [Vitreimonas sp.]
MTETLEFSAPRTFAAAMKSAQAKRFDAGRILNIRPDPPDFRDRFYEPGLVKIELEKEPPPWTPIALRDQGDEGTCTGQALAAVIDIQNAMRGAKLTSKARASARMIYEMARAHDEYPDDGLEGSSARGALKGFFHNGVCTEAEAPYSPYEPGWRLTVAHAKAARNLSLGAYLRLRHVLYDYHAAICEAGAVVVTSMVHAGWETDAVAAAGGRIGFKDPRITKPDGAHAFAIVGYDRDGFLILNSWGEGWGGYKGAPGLAHWSYEDWQAHVLDAWVLRLAVPSAKTFHKVGGFDRRHAAASARAPARSDLLGYYCHVEDGRFVSSGAYVNDRRTFAESANLVRQLAGEAPDVRYDHVLLYAHGGLTELDAAATHAALMLPVLKALRIYPLFFFWRTGALGAICDLLFGQSNRVAERAGAPGGVADWVWESLARQLVRPIWGEMKNDAARSAFVAPAPGIPRVAGLVGDAGAASLAFLDALAQIRADGQSPPELHIAGHSAGAILLCYLLQRWRVDGRLEPTTLASASLLAPACTVELFDRAFSPVIAASTCDVAIYALDDKREQADATGPYGNSILYLVSRALEERRKVPILGLEAHARGAAKSGRVKAYITGEHVTETDSADHGGFDNDPATLNHMLTRILGRPIHADNGGFSRVHFDLAAPRHGS